jgi:hypothetical protein
MKIIIRIIQVIVGLLFIVSGLIKANDPLGLSYKMEEFFALWNTGLAEGHFFAKNVLITFLNFLNAHSLFLSVGMITLEIVSGVALLLAWKKKFILYLLSVLILFFTFLTGYAYLSGKFTNCGCFGDCLPITPLTSFIKDLVLLTMIIALLAGSRYLQPVFSKPVRTVLVIFSLVASLFHQCYVLKYLPFVDCLPLKKGNNNAEKIKKTKLSTPYV